MVKATDNCGGCVHIQRQGGNFVCLRYPPTVFASPATDPATGQQGFITAGYYPPVTPGTRACGEFAAGNRVAVAQTLPKSDLIL